MHDQEKIFTLNDVEVETLQRAAFDRGISFDPDRREYTRHELARYGMVREGYTRDELVDRGFDAVAVTCFDDGAERARHELRVETPFGSGIEKWQLPIHMFPMLMHQTVFPPNSVVEPHVHPANTVEAPGGGLRIVCKGKILYEGTEYGPGDWFFIPNGVPYSFRTDPNEPTVVFYKYAFFGFAEGNRFSHPHAVESVDHSTSPALV